MLTLVRIRVILLISGQRLVLTLVRIRVILLIARLMIRVILLVARLMACPEGLRIRVILSPIITPRPGSQNSSPNATARSPNILASERADLTANCDFSDSNGFCVMI